MINEIAAILAKSLNAQTVLLYGSYAQNLQDAESDYDLLILTEKISSPVKRKDAYKQIPHAEIIEIAPQAARQKHGWDNSWSPINDALFVQNKRVEIGYNTTSWVNRVIRRLIVEHKTTFKEFSFRPYTFLGLLETCKVLYDRDCFVQTIQSQIRPIPIALKKAIAQEFYPILREAYEELKDYAKRDIGILAYQFHLFRGIDALIQLIFVLNDVYDPAFKRIEPCLFNLPNFPAGFKKFKATFFPTYY
jgi:hypothetical protein